MSLNRIIERRHTWSRIKDLRQMLKSGQVTAPCWITFLQMEIEDLENDLRRLEVL